MKRLKIENSLVVGRHHMSWWQMRSVLFAACFVVAFGFEGIAQAQSAIDEVVVTARRSAESVVDVPLAITVFTSKDIEDAGITSPEDFVNLTPNVVMVDTASVGDTQVTIRGLTSTRDAESSFALVVDGVLITNPNAFNRTLVDIEQIEVLKGPQGALYGRNALSGAILIKTKKPTDEFEGTLNGRYGAETGLYGGSLTASGALGNNARGRVAINYSESDGFETNLFTGSDSDIDYADNIALRGRLIFDTSYGEWDFRAGYARTTGGSINFNATFALPGFAAAFDNPAYFADVNAHQFQYFPNIRPENEQKATDISLKYSGEVTDDIGVQAVFAFNDLREYLLSDGTSASFGVYNHLESCMASLTSAPTAARAAELINGYPATYFAAFAPNGLLLGPYTPSTCDGFQYQHRNQEDLSVEVRFNGEHDNISWVAGGYFAVIDREVAVSYGADLGGAIDRTPYASGVTDLLFWDKFDTSVYSLFGQFTYDFSERAEIALESRYDVERREVSNLVPSVRSSNIDSNADGTADLGTLNPGQIIAANGSITPLASRNRSFSQFQPKLSFRYDIDDSTNIYTSYGYGFRSGGFNSQGSKALIDSFFNRLDGYDERVADGTTTLGDAVNGGLGVRDEYDKEVSQSLEFGFKGRYLDGRLQVNGAAFFTKVDDNQFFEFFAGPFGLMRVVTTIEELEILGIETDLRYAILDNLRLDVGIGFTDGEIKQNSHRPYTIGNKAPNTPDYTINVGIQWNWEANSTMAGGLRGLLRADYRYVGETWFHTVQNQAHTPPAIWTALLGFPVDGNFSRTSRDAYATLDIRATIGGDAWEVAFWGRNVLDEEYLAEIINAPEFGGSFIHEAPAREIGISSTYRF